MVFLAPLRGSKKGVLRGPSWTKRVLQLQFSVVLRGPPWSFVALRVLRGPSWPSVSFVDKRSCRCSSSRPFAVLRGQKGVAVAVLRGPPWPSVSFVDKKVLQLQFSVVLRGPPCPSWTKRCCSCSSPWSSVALRVLRGQKKLPLQFFAALRGPSWPFVDKKGVVVAVLGGPPWPFVDKKGFHRAPSRIDLWRSKHETHQRPDYAIQ